MANTCISCSFVCIDPVVIRDSAFPADDPLSALMTVCFKCAVEYVDVYERLMHRAPYGDRKFYRECFEYTRAAVAEFEKNRATEISIADTGDMGDMIDTMHFDPAGLFFSHASDSHTAPINLTDEMFLTHSKLFLFSHAS